MPAEIGRTGLSEFSGRISEDFLRELRGREAYKRFNEMRKNSPAIGGMLLAIENSIRKVEWQFISEEGDNDPRIEFLNENLKMMSHNLNDHVVEALTMLPFGFSIFEIVYQRLDGKMYWRKFAPRGQDTVDHWLFDDKGGISGFHQRTTMPVHATDIPIEKLLLYRTKVEKNNPEGWSILRTSWIPYYFQKHIQQIEGIGIERDLAGLPHVELPEGATTDENDTSSDAYKATKLVRRIRNDEQSGVVTPNGWIFKLVSTGGQRAFDTDKIIRRHESRMLMSALAQFLVLGQDSVGSLALSKDQSDFFNMSVNATADVIAETITSHGIPRLMRLNGMESQGVSLTHSPCGDVDLATLADFLSKLNPFLNWMPEDEMWLRSVAELPEQDIDTLRQAHEEKKQQKLAFQQAFQKTQGDKKAEGERDDEQKKKEGDQLTVYQTALDDDRRKRMEAKWNRSLTSFFREQRERIRKAAKKIQR